MNGYFEQAETLREELTATRRLLHGFAETGFALPRTLELVEKKLSEYGISPRRVGRAGVSCTIGGPGKTILLRADMDALPMREITGLPFAAENGNCHSCGHDCHTAMLLGAAKLLKAREHELPGTVKLMFQPAEEQLAGSKDMIDAGILDDPAVDAAIALHVTAGTPLSRTGSLYYARGPAMHSGDAITITIHGKNAHGSTPENGVDAINIAAHIVIALQEIISREVSSTEDAVVIVGRIQGGDTVNTLGGSAVMEASVRAITKEMRDFLKNRVREIAESVAATFRGRADVEFTYGISAMYNDPALSDFLCGSLVRELGRERVVCVPAATGSDDFTYIAERVPSVLFFLGAGSREEGYAHSMHHPGFLVDEEALRLGSAVYAHCAAAFLEGKL